MDYKRVTAQKRLGQNFLRDPAVIRRIVKALELSAADVVLEIGCGTGALTQHILAAKPGWFIGVELDRGLCAELSNRYSSASVSFLNKDILQVEIQEHIGDFEATGAKIKVVGNLPYYISSPIIDWLGRQSRLIEFATIMLQAEVADRVMASPGSKDFGVLTLLVNYYFSVTKLMDVRPGSFRPAPKVSSTVLLLRPKGTLALDSSEEAAFFQFVKRSFSQRRKTLWNCLKGDVVRADLEALLNRLGHPAESRAEALALDDFICLYKALKR